MSIITLALTPLFVLAALVLQTVAPDSPVPQWLIGAMPVISFAITEIIVRMGGELTGEQKKGVFRAVSLALVGGLMLFGQVQSPADLPLVPDTLTVDGVGEFITLLIGYAGALFTYIWGLGKTIHDGLDAAGVKDHSNPPPPAPLPALPLVAATAEQARPPRA